jgi:hypothetical protein
MATAQDALARYPAWMREPAKIVGWVVAAALTVAAGVTELAAEFTDLIPDKYRATVQTVVGVAAVVTVVATRVQALLTRNGIGPAGNGKDGVFSPATIDAARAQAHAAQDVVQGHVGASVAGLPDVS